MWTRLIIFSAFFFVTVLAATTDTSSRPKACPVGTTYTKDCNTCTCGSDASKDKCSKLDCKRISASASSTPRTPTGVRPGVCPTKVTPAPGDTTSCKRRDPSTSTCTKDTDCGSAKKCCEDGCKRLVCRNPIYNYTR